MGDGGRRWWRDRRSALLAKKKRNNYSVSESDPAISRPQAFHHTTHAIHPRLHPVHSNARDSTPSNARDSSLRRRLQESTPSSPPETPPEPPPETPPETPAHDTPPRPRLTDSETPPETPPRPHRPRLHLRLHRPRLHPVHSYAPDSTLSSTSETLLRPRTRLYPPLNARDSNRDPTPSTPTPQTPETRLLIPPAPRIPPRPRPEGRRLHPLLNAREMLYIFGPERQHPRLHPIQADYDKGLGDD
ncbi:hypothetical protein BJ508DRAFT_362684 [Ascobolus immersus RN42]|uniref:Uncharacterized protein n=1 Tax=Ascobolus immersus RN42 TaxID=1160509 RepID=A0A3N4I855_ASCIM|nr:hypothetical protein BJ508DRAFT_362684 [Ascobolus immersus RN42]